jgi:hypothetical protein
MNDWSQNWFGLWQGDDGKYPQLPVMEDFLDPNWNLEFRSKAAQYLNDAVAVLAAGSPGYKCKLCEHRHAQVWKSDGVWLWPDSLGHMVEAHDVRVPKRFEMHMESNGFTPPKELPNCDWKSLPWPKL